MDRRPSQLSGGQRQRVAMGRAIVRNPDVFLFDEPLSNLDAKLRTQMRTEIKKLHAKVQSTVIYVTHDQVEAMTLADRIVIMRDGYIEQVGTPDEVFQRPATRFVAGFIGSPPMNLHEATIDGGQMVFASGDKLPLPGQFSGQCRGRATRSSFGLRPDDIYPDRPRHALRRRQPTSTRSSCRSRSPSRSATRRWCSSSSTAATGCRACSTRDR